MTDWETIVGLEIHVHLKTRTRMFCRCELEYFAPPNMAGLPGLSIPCGLSEGLPVGLQLIGPQFSENLLFRAGHALERALEFDFVPERLR